MPGYGALGTGRRGAGVLLEVAFVSGGDADGAALGCGREAGIDLPLLDAVAVEVAKAAVAARVDHGAIADLLIDPVADGAQQVSIGQRAAFAQAYGDDVGVGGHAHDV